MKVTISNIQRFSLHDGPGIRTTVFLKGCNLSCPWCCNPENIETKIQQYEYQNQKGTYGYGIELKNLEKEILKDKKYYETGGGVTFSGGECLLQFDKLETLLASLKRQEINICIETALAVSEKFVDIALKYVDEFIVDLKILDINQAKKINIDVSLYMKNIEKIFKNNANVIFRIPLVPGYTVTEKNIKKILELLNKYKPNKVEIFKIHRLGESKYKTLGIKMPEFKEINDDRIKRIITEIQKLNTKVEYVRL